ncbi:MAG: tetratricopeptide repeat protein [Candidatus Poribacteria bacterium]|nr:tetratricopeptide repeat protein [Candidatus Poribacteria bacterium]
MFTPKQLEKLRTVAIANIETANQLEKEIFEDTFFIFPDRPFLDFYRLTQPMMSSLILGIELTLKLLHYASGGSELRGHKLCPIYDSLESLYAKPKLDAAYAKSIQDVFYTPKDGLPAMNPTMVNGKFEVDLTKSVIGSHIVALIWKIESKILDNGTPSNFAHIEYIFQHDNKFQELSTFLGILDGFELFDRYKIFEDSTIDDWVMIRPSAAILQAFIPEIFKIIDELLSKRENVYGYQGSEYLRSGDYDKAIECYDKVLELEPKSVEGFAHRAQVYRIKGDYNRAITECNTAISLNPDYALSYLIRGDACYDQLRGQGSFGLPSLLKIIEDYNKAIELKYDFAEAYRSRAMIYRMLNSDSEALEDLNKAIEFAPENANDYYNRGLTHRDNGDLNLAIDDLNKAIELKPDYANAYRERDEILGRLEMS